MEYTDGLETERLKTRFLKPEDAMLWAEFCADPICTAYFGYDNSLCPLQRAQEWITFAMKRYETGRLGLQALISRENGAFIGQCGLIVQEVNGREVIEIGYHLISKYHGNGYATEAAQMFRDYGFEHNFADSIVSIIHPLNTNSKKVAIRNGMKLVETKALFRGKECNLFRITRTEWELLNSK